MAWLFAAAALACLALRVLFAGRVLDATPLLVALAPINAATFSVRRRLAWSRGPVTPKHEAKTDLFAFAADPAPLAARERELRSAYRLAPLRAASTAHAYRENLYVLDILDRYAASARPRGARRALDVGSQDFRYAFALSRWLGPSCALTGIEIDGHHVYADLHSRREHAEGYVRQIDDAAVDYCVADFLSHREDVPVDVITFFFPFVLEYALLRWGLPRRHFLPHRILAHAKTLLRPGGLVVVMNHTEAERRRQLELLAEHGFEVVASTPVTSDLVDYAAEVTERSLTIARVV